MSLFSSQLLKTPALTLPSAPPAVETLPRHSPQAMLEQLAMRCPRPALDHAGLLAWGLAVLGVLTFMLASTVLPALTPLTGILGLLAILPGMTALVRQIHPGWTLTAMMVGAFCVHMSLRLAGWL